MSKTMQLLAKIEELNKRDADIKAAQMKLNQDISEFIANDIGVVGQATLLDISKKLLESTIEPSRIITP